MNTKFLLLLLTFTHRCVCQDFSAYIRNNARPLASIDAPDSIIYAETRSYALIMIGEMHGTNEPARFTGGMATMIAGREPSVSVGLEIPPEKMRAFLDHPSDSTLAACEFFTMKNIDGRNGHAWFDLIRKLYVNPKVHLFFIDSGTGDGRDSAMYLKVQLQREQFPEDRIITLSGNIHNRMVPFNDRPTMGSLLCSDSMHFDRSAIMSVNHSYKEGTMLNNTGHGLELHTVNKPDNLYSTAVSFPDYLMKQEFPNLPAYNYVLYTRKVTHSE